jgi:hypothetical protein
MFPILVRHFRAAELRKVCDSVLLVRHFRAGFLRMVCDSVQCCGSVVSLGGMIFRTAVAALLAGGLASGWSGSQEVVAARPPLIERLAGDSFFARLPLKAAPGFPPIDLVVQAPYGAKTGWEAAPSNRFGPWMRELAAQFEEHFAGPFALERGERFGAPGVVVLASEGDLLNFRRSIPGRRASSYGEACYDPGLDVVVVTATSSAPALHLARFSGLQMLVHRELTAHAAPGATLQHWLAWGLPAYLAWSTGTGPDSLRTREVDRTSLRDWILAGDGTNRAAGTLLPLLDLVGATDAAAAIAALERGAAAAGAKLTENPSYLAWCAACLWTHYLVDGDGGRWRDGYGAYLASALRGRGDGLALREALQLDEAGVRALEQGFEAWVRKTGDSLDLFVREAPAPTGTPLPVAELAPEPALPPIAPQLGEVALAHGLALVLAREGDLDGAIAALERAAAVEPEGALAKRVARDLERARGFRELRARFLGELAASGKLLALERDGKRINVRIAAVEEGRITLREARGGLEAISFAQLPSFAVARAMGREAGRLRAWPYALVDDPRWQDLLDDEDPLAAELRADAAEWYPGALRLGGVALELGAVGAAELPAEPAACEALAQRCATLVREHGALSEVDSRRPALRARAAAALERAWEPERAGEGLAGRLELLEGGRARLTYAFDAQAELDELAGGPMYPAQRAEGRPALLRAPELSVVHGGLRASGSHTWRLPLSFRAPLSARLEFVLGQVPDVASSFVDWSLGICDDGAGNLVLLEGLGNLLVIDLPAGVSTSAFDLRSRRLDRKRYTIELRHDGTTAGSWVEGEPFKELAADTRTSGDVLFSMHSDTPLSFEELVVEGEIDTDLVRARWLERRLIELGL